jgi:hypothetical protein
MNQDLTASPEPSMRTVLDRADGSEAVPEQVSPLISAAYVIGPNIATLPPSVETDSYRAQQS